MQHAHRLSQQVAVSPSPRSSTVDRAGIVASTICAVHCGASALAPGIVAALGMSAVFGETAEWSLTAAAVSFAVVSMVVGWYRHRSLSAVAALGLGTVGIILARVLEESGRHEAGVAFGILAGVGLVTGHIRNIRASCC